MATQLPVNTAKGGSVATGCCTPKEDKAPQKMSVTPKRVIPIIFLPGIMGSNLRNSAGRQNQLGNRNNIAWRPDRFRERQHLLTLAHHKDNFSLILWLPKLIRTIPTRT